MQGAMHIIFVELTTVPRCVFRQYAAYSDCAAYLDIVLLIQY